ncbi:MAG: S1 family peptidase [Sandaracinus sp.]|nr:S1 family peptidase [Sandaracinus sp.]
MRILSSLIGLGSVLTVAACVGAPTNDELSSASEAIVNGERTAMNEQAVVSVLNRFGGLCTGTLIAPRAVLTAKHCVQNPDAEGPSAASSFVVGIGDNIRGLSETYNVAELVTTPGRYSDRNGLSGALVGIDVAVLTLTQPVRDIEPILVERSSAPDLIGRMFRAVGFGQIPSGGAGTKYRTTTRISSVQGGVIYTPPTICQGDSGGPLLLVNEDGTDTVVGIASFGSGACGGGINGYNRVDQFLDLIDEAVRLSGTCVDDGDERCDGYDNDCNDLVDEVCADVGEACEGDDDCLSLTCRDGLCTQGCDPMRPFTGCPPGFYCGGSAGCEGFCVAGSAGALPVNAACSADTDCESLFCTNPFSPGSDEGKTCLEPCRGGDGRCIDGQVCAAGVGACGGCMPANVVVGSRGLGEPCAEDGECVSGACLVELDRGYCTSACERDSDCVTGYHCRMGAEAGQCVVGERGSVGSGCVENGDCSDTLFCAARGDVRWCTSFCTTDEECPPDFGCIEVAPGAQICVPDRGVVGDECATGDECISGVCEAVGSDGGLVCTRECSADALCDPGFECRRDPETMDTRCVPTTLPPETGGGGGGCTASGGGSPGFGFVALGFAVALVTRRRARSSRSRS